MVKNTVVPFETIVNIISNVKGPEEQLKKYLLLIEDLDRRMNLAVKFKSTDVIVDVSAYALEIRATQIKFFSFSVLQSAKRPYRPHELPQSIQRGHGRLFEVSDLA